MTKYEKIFSFSVLQEIEKGEKVYFMDRYNVNSYKAIITVDDMTIKEVFNCIKLVEADTSNRYEFFKKVEVKDE